MRDFFVLHRVVGRTQRRVLTPGCFESCNFPSVGEAASGTTASMPCTGQVPSGLCGLCAKRGPQSPSAGKPSPAGWHCGFPAPWLPALCRGFPASSCSPAPCVGCLVEPSVNPCRGPLPHLALWPKRTGHHFEILTNVDGTERTFQSLLGTRPPPAPTTITAHLRGAGWWGGGQG